jgi:hypothetical protein
LIIFEGYGRRGWNNRLPGGRKIPQRRLRAGLRKNQIAGGNFLMYPAAISGFMVRCPVFGKTGNFIMFLYPFTSTGIGPK